MLRPQRHPTMSVAFHHQDHLRSVSWCWQILLQWAAGGISWVRFQDEIPSEPAYVQVARAEASLRTPSTPRLNRLGNSPQKEEKGKGLESGQGLAHWVHSHVCRKVGGQSEDGLHGAWRRKVLSKTHSQKPQITQRNKGPSVTATETTDCRIHLSKDPGGKKNYDSYVWNKGEKNMDKEKSYKIINFIRKRTK